MKKGQRGRRKREKDKKQCKETKGKFCPKVGFLGLVAPVFSIKELCFHEVCSSRCEKKARNIKPVGGFAKRAVVRVEKDGNEQRSKCYAYAFDLPKAWVFLFKKSALNDGEE